MPKKEKYRFEPDFAVPPGETLKEVRDWLGVDSEEISKRTGIGIPAIEGILDGRTQIGEEIARKLEMGTGVPARLWRNLENQYQEQLAFLGEKNAARRILPG